MKNNTYLTNKTSSIFFGPIQIRFLATDDYKCFGDLVTNIENSGSMFFLIILQKLKWNYEFKCHSNIHRGNLIKPNYKLGNYTYSNSTNITHKLYSLVGDYDNTGTIAKFSGNE